MRPGVRTGRRRGSADGAGDEHETDEGPSHQRHEGSLGWDVAAFTTARMRR